MLVIKVELWSAINSSKTEIARMVIANDGTSDESKIGNYWGKTYRGTNSIDLDNSMKRDIVIRQSRVDLYPRKNLHVWNLVAKMLKNMKYK